MGQLLFAMLAAALAGLGLRRWIRAYAGRLAADDAPGAGTFWAAVRDAHGAPVSLPWDGACAVLMGVGAGMVLQARGGAGLALGGLCLALAALAWLDARTGLLPDALTLPLMAAGWLWGPLPLTAASSASALVWAGLATAAAAYRWLRGREGFGGGDVKYLAALAAWLGAAPTVFVLWLACLLGAAAWALLPRVRRTGACPFGPCMTLAALPVALWGCGPPVFPGIC
jgi:leader peptidase (prepilin peptidase)/N-methyltransferase